MRPLKIAAALFAIAASLAAQLPFDAASDFLKLPDRIHLGEVAGVATNSRGNVFVYTRTGGNATTGASRTFTHGGSRLFEFDRTGKFVREIGDGVYGFLFAQAVRVDAADHIWVVDRGSNMVIKFNPQGRVVLTLGRKPEAEGGAGRGGGRGGPNTGAGVSGDNFSRPTDVAFDAAGNIYVSDGMGNARVAKFDPSGRFVKSWGTRGAGPGQFDTPVSLAIDAQGNVYVADRGNRRIQVFDAEGVFKRQIGDIGAPSSLCISPGAHPYLYTSNSNDPANLENGEIYRLELDGKILGRFGTAGKLPKEFGTVNAIDCREPNQLLVGEVLNWRVQRIMLKP